MTVHVDHLLAAYVENQLDAHSAQWVYRHVQSCVRCRAHLTQHEQLADSLRREVQTNRVVSSSRVGTWWYAIIGVKAHAAGPRTYPALIPIIMTLLVMLFPLTLGLTGLVPWQPASIGIANLTEVAAGTALAYASPAAGLIPLPHAERVDPGAAATPAPQMALPVAPAPLAPTEP